MTEMVLPDRNDYRTGEDDLAELCLLCRAPLGNGEDGVCELCLAPLGEESDFQDTLREIIGTQKMLLRQIDRDLERAEALLNSYGKVKSQSLHVGERKRTGGTRKAPR